MASKQSYECYVCKRNGFPDTRVYLDGKSKDGKTIYKNEDMSVHQHKQQQQSQQTDASQFSQSKNSPTGSTQEPLLKIINAKLDRIIAMLSESQQQQSTTK